MKDKILLFIPCYNCAKQIQRVLAQVTAQNQIYFSEILVINNRSTDASEQQVIAYAKSHADLPITVLRNQENYGLGGSHKVAFEYAIKHHLDYIVVLHGDDQGMLNDLIPYLKDQTYRKYDCLLGARFMKGSHLEGYSKFRMIGNWVYNGLFSLITWKKIWDLGSGLNMYNISMLQNRFYQKYPDSLLFNYCMILGTVYYRYRFYFFPIVWRETDQVSNVKLTSQALCVLKLLGKYILNKKTFIIGEHRTIERSSYPAEIIYSRGKHV